MPYPAVGEAGEFLSEEFLCLFFNLRDKDLRQYQLEAATLLTQKKLHKTVHGIDLELSLMGKDFYCSATPAPTKALKCALVLPALGWRKSRNLEILTDRIVDCEARAILGYSVQHWLPTTQSRIIEPRLVGVKLNFTWESRWWKIICIGTKAKLITWLPWGSSNTLNGYPHSRGRKSPRWWDSWPRRKWRFGLKRALPRASVKFHPKIALHPID